jgi:hypothetical protein
MVAGQIDSIWVDPVSKSFHMIDWKRCSLDCSLSLASQRVMAHQSRGVFSSMLLIEVRNLQEILLAHVIAE